MISRTERANRIQAAVLVVVQTLVTFWVTNDLAAALRALLVWCCLVTAWLLWRRRRRAD